MAGIRISGTVHDSIVDGPGLRYVIFTQGCLRDCPGCHNRQTHDPAGGTLVTAEVLIADMRRNPLADGLTLSGGEPFLQAAALSPVVWAARKQGLSVWTYTGYTWEELAAARNPAWESLLDGTDVLVDGPFVLNEKSLLVRFRGSRNQRLIDVAASRAAGDAALYVP